MQPRLLLAIGSLLVAGPPAAAQQSGAARLHQLVTSITVTPRVLLIGAHPDDVDQDLVAWLSLGRGIETAYLSLTRGEAGDNYLGTEAGTLLGALRTEETLAARRIDGAEQFFTRAYDFGFARNADEAFKSWNADTLLTDVVRIVRSFRPHVVISLHPDTLTDGIGVHHAAGLIAKNVIAAAADVQRFSPDFGLPWAPQRFVVGTVSLLFDPAEYNQVIGATYERLAADARDAHRSQSLTAPFVERRPVFRTMRPPQPGDTVPAVPAGVSIFDGIDTTIARLTAAASDTTRAYLDSLVASADSARLDLDLEHPGRIVRHLARAVRFANSVRALLPWCGHPAQDAVPPAVQQLPCDPRLLDLDASIDRMRRRAHEALFLAAGVVVEVSSDRDLGAFDEAVGVRGRVSNHGDSAVVLNAIDVTGAASYTSQQVIEPGTSVNTFHAVRNLATPNPWWFGQRKQNFYPHATSPVDGIANPGLLIGVGIADGVTIPEGIRRTSDVRVSATIAGVSASMSVGPVTQRYMNPLLGVQRRPLASVPAVSLGFSRGLEWIIANKPIDRRLRLSMKSFSNTVQNFSLAFDLPTGLRMDSLPPIITLAPREQRELILSLKGRLPEDRHQFAVVGRAQGRDAQGRGYIAGLQVLEHPHVRPIRTLRSSGLWLQAADIKVPTRLSVLYLQGERDDVASSLRQIGVPVVVVNTEELLTVDLSQFTTMVIGPNAYDVHRDLAAQQERLFDFVRKGGTLLVMQQQFTMTRSTQLAHPVVLTRPQPERVATPDAPVTVIDTAARVLKWPNAIGALDWKEWVGGRAAYVPRVADPQYRSIIEMHDPGERPNPNTVLLTRMGKGTYVYTTLTFAQQIPGGVPGAFRLFVNLLSSSLPADSRLAIRSP